MSAAVLTAVLILFSISVGAGPKIGPSSSVSAASPNPLGNTSSYYTVRPDLRRCVSPLCGGYWVKRVNHAFTLCANGRRWAECYVAEIEWGEQTPTETPGALLRGTIVAKHFGRFGNLGALQVTESWQAATDRKPAGVFYRLTDSGIRCITYPCLTIEAAKLNSSVQSKFAGVKLGGAGAKQDLVAEAMRAMSEAAGLIVAGLPAQVSGPAGRASELKAAQFYSRVGKQTSGSKPCFRTGCSSHVCADENVITTCEWREEYACYQKAKCERQANGKCGFTMTPELQACLKGK